MYTAVFTLSNLLVNLALILPGMTALALLTYLYSVARVIVARTKTCLLSLQLFCSIVLIFRGASLSRPGAVNHSV
jgi:hypothetical protein